MFVCEHCHIAMANCDWSDDHYTHRPNHGPNHESGTTVTDWAYIHSRAAYIDQHHHTQKPTLVDTSASCVMPYHKHEACYVCDMTLPISDIVGNHDVKVYEYK